MSILEFYKNYKIEVWNFSFYDCYEATNYLNEMVEKGYVFQMYAGGLVPMAIYKKEKCSNVRFAVDVIKPDSEEEVRITKQYIDSGFVEVSDLDANILLDGLRFFRAEKKDAVAPHDDAEARAKHLVKNSEGNSRQTRRMLGGILKVIFGFGMAFAMEFVNMDSFELWIRIVGVCLALHGALQLGSCVIGAIRVFNQEKQLKGGQLPTENKILNKLSIGIEYTINVIPPIFIGAIILILDYLILSKAITVFGIFQVLFFTIIPVALIGYYPKASVEDSKTYDYLEIIYCVVFIAILILRRFI